VESEGTLLHFQSSLYRPVLGTKLIIQKKKEDSNSMLLEISLNEVKSADVYTQNYLSILE
jgi:hypothetical protein